MFKVHWSYHLQYFILTIFLSVMVYVTYIAFNRHSGSTGLDMAKIQQIRYDAAHIKEKNDVLAENSIP